MADRVREVMASVPRVDFLPAEQHRFAAADQALPIGHGATCSQPSTVARMLELLAPAPRDRVLDVGSGSGWTTALLTHLVGPGGWVVGVEIEPALVGTSRANLQRVGVTGARVEQAVPGELGLPAEAPYDRILVSAEARTVPRALVGQLADGGRLLVPVAGDLMVLDRTGTEERTRREGTYSFVPLQEG